MRHKLLVLFLALTLALTSVATAWAGSTGYEGQPGNQGNGLGGYEGQPGNQGG